MRNSTFQAVTASFAAVAIIVSLGTSPVFARGGGGGGGGIHTGGGFHGGGFHSGGAGYGGFRGDHRFYGGGYNSGYNTCVVNPYYTWRNSAYPYTC